MKKWEKVSWLKPWLQ